MLSEKDLKQIAQRGITKEQIETQLKEFETGFPFLKLEAAAAVGRERASTVRESLGGL